MLPPCTADFTASCERFYCRCVWLAPASQSALWLAQTHSWLQTCMAAVWCRSIVRILKKLFPLGPTSLRSRWCSVVAYPWPVWAPVEIQPTPLPWRWQATQVGAASPPLRTVLSDRTLSSSLHLPPHPQRSPSQRKRVCQTIGIIFSITSRYHVCGAFVSLKLAALSNYRKQYSTKNFLLSTVQGRKKEHEIRVLEV